MSKTLIAVPTLSTVYVEFVHSVINLLAHSVGKANLGMEQNSLTPAARNALAFRAIEGGYDRILFVDSDMKFDADALEQLSATMDETNADLVSALFFMRKLPTHPTIAKEVTWERDEKTGICTGHAEYYTEYPLNSVFRIGGTGMAFTLIKTDLIKNVTDHYAMAPFDQLPNLGEDYSFCWKAGQLSAKMVCDSRVGIGHIGTYIYDEQTYLTQKGYEP